MWPRGRVGSANPGSSASQEAWVWCYDFTEGTSTPFTRLASCCWLLAGLSFPPHLLSPQRGWRNEYPVYQAFLGARNLAAMAKSPSFRNRVLRTEDIVLWWYVCVSCARTWVWHTCIRGFDIHIYAHTYMQIHHTHTYTHVPTYTHIHIHMYIHTCARVHTHTQICLVPQSNPGSMWGQTTQGHEPGMPS